MKDKAGLTFPRSMMSLGVYALLTAFGRRGKHVTRIDYQAVPRGLAIAFDLTGTVGGSMVLMTALSNRKIKAQPRT